MNNKRLAYVLVAVLALACAIATSACSATNLDAKAIEDKYGVSGATTENILTADGAIMSATVVPVTLPDGRKAQLVIPQKGGSNSVYLRDQAGLYQVQLQDRNVSRDQFIRSNPTVVERRAVPQKFQEAFLGKGSINYWRWRSSWRGYWGIGRREEGRRHWGGHWRRCRSDL